MEKIEKILEVRDHFAKYKHVKSNLIFGNTAKKKQKVSICIPTFKRIDTLITTVESCINQEGYADYNIIICDNNPERNDETENYVKALANERILYYKNSENIGMYGNINRLFELSTGEYTVCIHDDDVLSPVFLQRTCVFLDKHEDYSAIFPKRFISDAKVINYKDISKEGYFFEIGYKDFLFHNPYANSGFIIRTSTIMNIGGFDYDSYPSNDYYFNIKLITKYKVVGYSEPLYLYRLMINESLKLKTKEMFIEADIPIIKYIAHKCNLYPLSQKVALAYYTYTAKTGLFFLDKNYNNKQIINLLPYYNISSLSLFFVRLYQKTYIILRKLCVRKIKC